MGSKYANTCILVTPRDQNVSIIFVNNIFIYIFIYIHMYMYAGILLLLLVRSNISLISILCNTVFIKSNLHEFQIHYDQNDFCIYI